MKKIYLFSLIMIEISIGAAQQTTKIKVKTKEECNKLQSERNMLVKSIDDSETSGAILSLVNNLIDLFDAGKLTPETAKLYRSVFSAAKEEINVDIDKYCARIKEIDKIIEPTLK